MWSYAHAGISAGPLDRRPDQPGQPIAMKDLQPGDVIFMWPPGAGTAGPPEHVTLYIGNNLIVQAPHVGSYVEVTSIYWWPTAGRAAYRFPVTRGRGRLRLAQPVPPLPVPPPTTTTTAVPGH